MYLQISTNVCLVVIFRALDGSFWNENQDESELASITIERYFV